MGRDGQAALGARLQQVPDLAQQHDVLRHGLRLGSSPALRRAISAFTGLTTKKKIAAATVRNAITALRNAP